MKRISVWAIALLLAAGLGSVSRAGSQVIGYYPGPLDPAGEEQPRPWLNKLFSSRKGTPQKPQPAIKAPGPRLPESSAALEARAQQNLFRRQAICNKLREIAVLTNDEALSRKADQLDQRAWDLFLKNSGHLPLSDTGSLADQRIFQRRLGASPASNLAPAAGRGNAGQASVRGVQP